MGTRDYKAWRFRKRYYKQFNNHDSYPAGLGRWITQKIPSERQNPGEIVVTVQADVCLFRATFACFGSDRPETCLEIHHLPETGKADNPISLQARFNYACQRCETQAGQTKTQYSRPEHLDRHMVSVHGGQREIDYDSWLQSQRDMVEQWEKSWEESGAFGDDTGQSTPEEKPSWFAPLNDLFIEWVYIIDLDREVLSINNSVHLRLDQVRHLTGIGALEDAGLGGQYRRSMVLVPGFLPEDAVTRFVCLPCSPLDLF